MFIACSLVRPAHLDQLVNYVLQTPADEENEKIKYKLVLHILFGKNITSVFAVYDAAMCWTFEAI